MLTSDIYTQKEIYKFPQIDKHICKYMERPGKSLISATRMYLQEEIKLV